MVTFHFFSHKVGSFESACSADFAISDVSIGLGCVTAFVVVNFAAQLLNLSFFGGKVDIFVFVETFVEDIAFFADASLKNLVYAISALSGINFGCFGEVQQLIKRGSVIFGGCGELEVAIFKGEGIARVAGSNRFVIIHLLYYILLSF